MQLSVVIRNALVVDGTGRPAFAADVGIAGDRIARIGHIAESGDASEIDAKGLVLAPGFIDPHTHYDPQLCWDRLATPSLEHGTTTVVIGNCSFTLAPIKPAYQQAVSELFIKAEDMTQAYFDAAVPYAWSSVEEYLDFIRPGLGINVAPLASHTLIRHFVMGTEAQQRTASADEIGEMCGILRDACRAGAVGMSFSYADTDMNNDPIACRWSDFDEKLALAQVLSEEGKGYLQVDLEFLDQAKMFEQIKEIGEISIRAGVTCAALGVFESPLDRTLHRRQLFAVEEQNQRGARVLLQTSTRPFDWNYSLDKTFFMFFLLPSWNEIAQMDLGGRIAAYSDLTKREALESELQGIMPLMAGTHVIDAVEEVNRPYIGRRITEIAREQGRSFTDVLLDIALADSLATQFEIRDVSHADVNAVAEIMRHPLVQIGGADSGAHLTQFCGAGDTTWMLEHWVRRTGKFTLEEAIKRITSDIAHDLNIPDRGTIRVGYHADLVLFDRAEIARGEQEFTHDLPGGSGRFMWRSQGIRCVLVNGQTVYRDGAYTDARAGQVI